MASQNHCFNFKTEFLVGVILILILSLISSATGYSLRSNRGSPFNITSFNFNFSPQQLPDELALRNAKSRLGGPNRIRFNDRNKKFPPISDISNGDNFRGQCGWSKVDYYSINSRIGRIVGGKNVINSPIPWQGSLQVRDNSKFSKVDWKHICGATLISQHHLVTASHCIGGDAKYRIVLGKLKMSEESPHEQIFYIRDRDITTHREFGFLAEFGNDIAILKIEDRQGRGVVLTPFVHPICMPDHDGWESKMLPPKAHCIVSGWGSTRNPFSEEMSNSLRVASVPIHSQETCRKLYDSGRDSLQDNFLRRRRSKKSSYGGGQRYVDGMMCAGPLTGSSVDSGRGDSGGPLACKKDGRYYLVGIVSWGDYFGGTPTPGVYTRVSHYMNWLESEKQLLGPS